MFIHVLLFGFGAWGSTFLDYQIIYSPSSTMWKFFSKNSLGLSKMSFGMSKERKIIVKFIHSFNYDTRKKKRNALYSKL